MYRQHELMIITTLIQQANRVILAGLSLTVLPLAVFFFFLISIPACITFGKSPPWKEKTCFGYIVAAVILWSSLLVVILCENSGKTPSLRMKPLYTSEYHYGFGSFNYHFRKKNPSLERKTSSLSMDSVKFLGHLNIPRKITPFFQEEKLLSSE